jgi:hypothetical protein
MRALLVAAVLALAPVAAFAQSLTVVAADGKETVLTADALKAVPRAEAVLHQGDKPPTYQGPSLSAVLREAGVPGGPRLHGKVLATYIVVIGADGYRAILSLAEIDGSFRDGAVILADKRADGPLAENEGPWRLVVSDDKRPERAVRQVVRVEVKPAP